MRNKEWEEIIKVNSRGKRIFLAYLKFHGTSRILNKFILISLDSLIRIPKFRTFFVIENNWLI